MFFKLSVKNIRKSFKDYTLYFLTLTFAVSIFYIFNSIEAQKSMLVISKSALSIMKSINNLMGYVSIFISFILGFLIVYANNFLIRRRKKELGIYMTLGMEKGKVARMLVSETFLIGILSLGIGLIAGIFLSQGLSVVTARLFEVDMTSYKFIFSSDAFVKTIIYFGLIFLIVMILSVISISKYKLINLINADKKNQDQKLKNPVLTVALFILSIFLLWKAYSMILKNGLTYFDNTLFMEIALGIIGTFLFFASLSGFFLKVLQARKKYYFKHLNMFVLRQINFKINTAFISMSLICLLLFATIGILSTGLSMNNALNSAFNSSAPFDASFEMEGKNNILKAVKQYNFDLKKYTDSYVEFSMYKSSEDNLTKSMILNKIKDLIPKSTFKYTGASPLYMLKLSDYNKLMALQGKPKVSLSNKEVAIFSDYTDSTSEFFNGLSTFIENKNTITLAGSKYNIYPGVLTDGVVTTNASSIIIALVVPDSILTKASPVKTMLSFNCKDNNKSVQQNLESEMMDLLDKNKNEKAENKIHGSSKNIVKATASGGHAMISFLCIYLGIVFLITCTAILALQQLSEATDNRRRYDILKKIGADDKMINSALFKQIAIYFTLPLALAIVHSIVGIKVTNDTLREAGGINALSNIIITAVLITFVYGSYFLATYFSSKRIILRSRV